MLSGSKPTPPLEMPPLPVPIAPTSLPSARSPCAFAQGDRPMSLAHFRSKLRDFFHSSYDRRRSRIARSPAVIDRRYSSIFPFDFANYRCDKTPLDMNRMLITLLTGVLVSAGVRA